MKTIDLSKTVNELCTLDPALIPILAGMGFTEIVKPLMLSTVGKIMTIPKGASMRGIDLKVIRATLVAQGYEMKEGD
jgi:hypothetical protein